MKRNIKEWVNDCVYDFRADPLGYSIDTLVHLYVSAFVIWWFGYAVYFVVGSLWGVLY